MCASASRGRKTERDGQNERGRERERIETELDIWMFCSVHAVMEEADDGNHNFMPWK